MSLAQEEKIKKNIIKHQILGLLAVLSYIVWGFIYNAYGAIETANLLLLRFIASGSIFLYVVALLKVKLVQKHDRFLFLVIVTMVMAHLFFLVNYFSLDNQIVLISIILGIFVMSNCMETNKELIYYYVMTMVLAISLQTSGAQSGIKVAVIVLIINFILFSFTSNIARSNLLKDLEKERSDLDKMVRRTADVHLSITPQGKILEYVNDKKVVFCDNINIAVGDNLCENFHGENLTQFQNALNNIGADNHREKLKYDIETETIVYSLDSRIVYIDSNKYIVRIRNVTKLSSLESIISDTTEKSFKIARLAELGELSAGIAHEINNPVAIIDGNAKRILKYLKKNDEASIAKIESRAQIIAESCSRITKTIRGLKDFSYDASNDSFELSDVTELMESVNNLCLAKCKSRNVEYRANIQENLELECITVQIEQVFVNLINNATDAIVDVEDKWIEVNIRELNASQIEFSVTDSGNGIDKKLAKNILKPFFTTKGSKKGTGLGLSLSAKIIKGHGGELVVDHSCANTKFMFILSKKREFAQESA